MDPATAVGSALAAFGLSGAAGLNAWVPMLGVALAGRLGWVETDASYDFLESTPALIVLSVGFVVDFVGDKVPVVDHVLHAVGGVVGPAAGAIVFAAQSGVAGDLDPNIALVLGAITAGTIHVGRASMRPLSTATTAGAGNPVVSLVEDAGAAVLTVVAFLLPILAALAVLAVVVAGILAWRALRRRRR